eukprot:203705_1
MASFVASNQLTDLNKMYHNLQTRLASCQNLSDFSPFIETLFSKNELKQQLFKFLEQQFEQERIANPPSSNRIRSLYIETNEMQIIPSMDVQAHILSYVPSRDFLTLHLVSKHFNQILRQYANIYNDNHYILEVTDFIGDSCKGWKTRICHQKARVFVQSQSNEPLLQQQIPKPYNQIKRWTIYHDDNQGSNHLLSLLQNNINQIHSLNLMYVPDAFTRLLSEQSVSFHNCKVLKAQHYIKCTNMFSKLRYLNIRLYGKDAHRMLAYLPKSLLFLSIFVMNTHGITDEVIKIPSTVQWLRTYGENGISYDLSECDELMGWATTHSMFERVLQNTFLWPIDHVIPYIRINNWYSKNYYMKSMFPARLVWLSQISDAERDLEAECMTLDEVRRKLSTFSNREKRMKPEARWFVLKWHSYCDGTPGTNNVLFESVMEMSVLNKTERTKKMFNIDEVTKLGKGYWIKNMYIINSIQMTGF